ncbi:TPA: hypothetical protein ACPVZG_000375 [Vibrio parahaemolyticus]
MNNIKYQAITYPISIFDFNKPLGRVEIKSAEELGSETLREQAIKNFWSNLICDIVFTASVVALAMTYKEIHSIGYAAIATILVLSVFYQTINGERRQCYLANCKSLSYVSEFESKCIKEVMREYPELRFALIRMDKGHTLRAEADFIEEYDQCRQGYLRDIERELWANSH